MDGGGNDLGTLGLGSFRDLGTRSESQSTTWVSQGQRSRGQTPLATPLDQSATVGAGRLGSGPFYCVAKLAKLAERFGCVILCGHSQR